MTEQEQARLIGAGYPLDRIAQAHADWTLQRVEKSLTSPVALIKLYATCHGGCTCLPGWPEQGKVERCVRTLQIAVGLRPGRSDSGCSLCCSSTYEGAADALIRATYDAVGHACDGLQEAQRVKTAAGLCALVREQLQPPPEAAK